MEDRPCHNSLWNSPYHKLLDKYIYVAKLHRAILERQLSKTGVYRSQHQFLMYIVCHPKASQKEIAERYHISTATVAVTLKKLEKGGYIHRLVHQEDNRFNQISITERGQAVVDKSMKLFQAAEEQMFRGFDEAEQTQLMGFLDRMESNLQQQLKEAESED